MMLKFADINKVFSEIVARFFQDGWRINAGTMDGTQGEVAKIDLTNGTRIVRVLMSKDMDARLFQNVIRVMVGYADSDVPCDVMTYNTIWNNHLDIIEMRRFVEIRDGAYMEMDNGQIENIHKLRSQRFAYKYHVDSLLISKDITSEAVKKVITPAVRRRIGFKSVKPSDIETVIRNKRNGVEHYDIIVRSKRVTI